MRNTSRFLVSAAGAATILLGGLTLEPGVSYAEGGSESVEAGKEVAYSRKKGNCLACHVMGSGESPGTIGPPLVSMKARFPKREDLKAQLYDSTVRNPVSMMPPFGKHKILSDAEIEQVVDFVLTL